MLLIYYFPLMEMPMKAMLDIILIEDNPSDVELTLDALKTHNLANRVKVLQGRG